MYTLAFILLCTSSTSTECERDDESFMLVAVVTRFLFASSMSASACAHDSIGRLSAPLSTTPSAASRSSTPFSGTSRSCRCSM